MTDNISKIGIGAPDPVTAGWRWIRHGGPKPVSSYTITIAPDDPTRATTTLRVEITGTTTRITELLVRAGDGDGLTAGQLPSVDIDQLLRAVVPTLPTPMLDTPAEAQPSAPVGAVTQPGAATWSPAAPNALPDPPVPTKSSANPRTRRGDTATATKVRRRTGTGASSSSGSRTSRSGRTSATSTAGNLAALSRAAKSAKVATGKATAKTAGTGGRSYRRAPADLAEVLTQIQTPSAVADHYGVPRHTAQSWLRTIRRRAAVTP